MSTSASGVDGRCMAGFEGPGFGCVEAITSTGASLASVTTGSVGLCTFCAEDGGGDDRLAGRHGLFFHSVSSTV
jgi:hypothetical protein